MTKTLTTAFSRGLCLAALAGFGLVATPGTARAEFITFTVVEGVVPGTPDNTFEADKLNGGFTANLTLNGDANPFDGSGSGTWSEEAESTFSQYFLNGSSAFTQYIGDVESGANDDGYVILGTLSSTGTYVEDSCGGINCIVFTFETQVGSLGIDYDQDGVVDIDLLSASGVADGSNGILLFSGGVNTATGSFNSNFLNNTLAAGIAQDYWPTLKGIQFITTINGDVDGVDITNPEGFEGDVSVQFTEVEVPEPATLSLLGLGLFGAAGVARRRRAMKA